MAGTDWGGSSGTPQTSIAPVHVAKYSSKFSLKYRALVQTALICTSLPISRRRLRVFRYSNW